MVVTAKLWFKALLVLTLFMPNGLIAQENTGQVHLRGVVMPAQKVKFSFAQPGIIIDIASGGALVEKGQLLAKLDDKKVLAKLEQSRAELRSAKSELASAKHQRDKSARLVAENILSDIALTEADFTVAVAVEKVAVAKAKLSVAKKDLEQCIINAPFDGAVVAKSMGKGEWVKAGDAVLEFVNFSKLSLSIDIPPSMADGLSVGMQTDVLIKQVTVGNAQVKTIYPVIDPASGLRRIVWTITANEGQLLPGRYVSLRNWSQGNANANSEGQ